MADFQDFDVEIQDERGNTIQQENGTVATAGVPVTITPNSGSFTSVLVTNPSKGPNKNGNNDVLLVSLDGGTTYTSVARGGFISAQSIYIDDVRIDTDSNGTNYEAVLTHD